MSSLGERLRGGREEKGVSIGEVSKATKISISVLQALESDQYRDLPPDVYVRGFIRSYCRYVGLDETEPLKTYEEAGTENRAAESRARKEAAARGNRTRLFLLLALFAVLAALFIHDSLLMQPNVAEVIPKPPSEMSTTSAAAPTAQKEAIIEEQTSPSPAIPIRMVISCISRSWLEITIDRDRPFQVNLVQGDEVCWTGEERIELRVGNAGGLRITVNDIPLKLFGEPEEVVNLRFERNAVSLNDGDSQELKRWERQEEINTGP
jgi:cytoskeletal protein RodZ